jgi:NAD(P)-dependent dehydrogenase (short-subunit alcohol dehydrogenase family)
MMLLVKQKTQDPMLTFTELQKIDLSTKTVLTTGANNGLGYETSRYFAQQGATVLMTSRSKERGDKAVETIQAETPTAKLILLALDLGDSKSIEALSKTLHDMKIKIDILINNAGIMAVPYSVTKDGYESQIGVNHLGHFRLTALILDLISDQGRIVNISSMAHKAGTLNFNNFMYEKGAYTAFGSYSRSKLCNLLYTNGLGDKLTEAGKQIIVTSAHPGVAKTGLFDMGKRSKIYQFFINLYLKSVQSAQDGAKPSIMAALDPQANSGDFYGPSKVKGEIRLDTPVKAALDKQNQDRLWSYSLDITKISYHFK